MEPRSGTIITILTISCGGAGSQSLFKVPTHPTLQNKKYTTVKQKQEQQQPLIDFENGVIVKIYKS